MVRNITCSLLLLGLLMTMGMSQPRNQQYEQARKYYYEGQYPEALRTINEYLSKKKYSVEGYYLAYMIHDAMGEHMRAIRSLTEIIHLDPAHLDAKFKRGELYYRKGIYKQALQDFNDILSFDGQTNTNAVYFKIDPQGEEQVQVTSLSSMKGQVYGLRGLTHQAMGEYEDALQDLNYAVKMDSSAQNLVNRALLYREINNVMKSREDLRTAVTLDPGLVLAWFNLLIVDPEVQLPEHILSNTTFIPLISYQAVEALQNNDLELAQALFTRALQVNPNDPLLLANAGRLSYKMDRFRDAITFHQRVLQLDPGHFEVYYLMGNSYFQLKEYNQAAAYYEQYLSRDRSDPGVWYNTALAYRELNDQSRACDCLSNAISRGMTLDPSSSLLKDCNQ